MMSQECITDQVTGGAAMYFHFFKNVSEMSGRTFLEQKLFLSINILRKKIKYVSLSHKKFLLSLY